MSHVSACAATELRAGPRFFQVLRVVRESTLTPTERLVMVMLASRGGDRHAPCPAVATLARDTGFTTRTVERALASLARKGWLGWRSAASRYGTNVYELRPPMPRPAPPTPTGDPRTPPDPRQTITGAPTLDRMPPDPVPDDLSSNPIDPLCEPPEATPASQTRPTSDSTHTDGSSRLEAESAILSAIVARPELAPIARPELASRLAAAAEEHKVALPDAVRAIGELAGHAGDAAATGAPWPAETLRRRARTYVARAAVVRPVERLDAPPPRAKRLRRSPDDEQIGSGDLTAHVPALRMLVAGIGDGPDLEAERPVHVRPAFGAVQPPRKRGDCGP